MATTWIKPLHVHKGKTIAQTISGRTDYASNPDKTQQGELVSGYECSPRTVDAEFLLSKRIYSDITGRDQGERDVLAYHIRQSFKPGEITPELANEIGCELAKHFTKGHHAFIVATHTDKSHIHNHIIVNSTNLDCNKKFRNFKGSNKAIRRISDRLCLENGLSIIENPKSSRGHYGSRNAYVKEPTLREKLIQAIDIALEQKPVDFEAFLNLMSGAGYEIKRGKHTAFREKGNKSFIRLRSLGDGYSEDAIQEIIIGRRVKQKVRVKTPQPQPENLLIQIQKCVKPKGSPGYDRWAAVFNLKQIVKTFEFLQENNLLEYEKLEEKAKQSKDDFNGISNRINAINERLPEISSLQKHIGTYIKTKDIYAEYRKSGWSKKFHSIHKEEIEKHKAAKKAFDELGLKKLPTMSMLQTEYATLLAEKKTLYSQYKSARQFMQDILTVKQNAEQLIGYSDTEKTKTTERS